MLSPKDYDLIVKWKRRGIPKEVIYIGTNKALFDLRKKKAGDQLPRSIWECAPYIEEEIKNYWRGKKNTSSIESGRSDFITNVAERLAAKIKSEKRERIKRYYVQIRTMVLDLMNSNEDVFKALENIEEESYEAFFQTLPHGEKVRIEQMAEGMIDKKRGHLMTERAYRESILSFRNEILKRDYELRNVFSSE
jgi:hypothetical protein